MHKNSRIFVAGHRGLVGSAICRRLQRGGYDRLILRTRYQLDLCDPAAVEAFVLREAPEYVFLAAAKVGGILANSTYPVEFLRENLAIQTNVLTSAHRQAVKKVLVLGSSCIYPRHCAQPIREEYLLSGPLEPTNEWYAIAKIAGIKLAQAYRQQYGLNTICLMPTNLYGPGDNFDVKSSHVLPALMYKADQAVRRGDREVVIWGTGTPRREFLHVDDLADAALFLMLNYDEAEIINVGTGKDISIRCLAEIVLRIASFSGQITFDTSKPDGTPRKLLDISRLTALGWKADIGLEDGITRTYSWYVGQQRVTGTENTYC
jgi:GDP-L-fucose synthase